MRRIWVSLAVLAVALVVLPLGQAGTGAGQLYFSFESAVPSGDHPDAAACPSPALCLVVDGAGNVFSSTDAPTGNPTWGSANVDGTSDLAAISCPSVSFCAAVDSVGNVLTSTDPGGGAAAWTVISADAAPLSGVSCVSASFCAAVDKDGYILTSTDPTSPSGWSNIVHADGTTALNGVSCPTTTLCVAVDDAGNVLTSTNPTSGSWQSASVGTSNEILSVACPSSSLCLAGGPDEILNTTNPTGGAGAWTDIGTGETLDSLSCPSTGFCTGVDTSGDFWSSTDPFEPSYTWGFVPINPGPLTGVSCSSTTLCVAVAPTDKDGGSAGYALAGIQAPTVVTGAATATTITTATLAGTVNPNGGLVSMCGFFYGTTASYTSYAACSQSPGEGTGEVAVSAPISGLSPDTTYHFQLLANNHNVGAVGSDETFTTGNAPPPPPPSYMLTVHDYGTGSGVVTSSPTGITCGSTCSYGYPWGTQVTLTATPASGSVFDGWSGACSGTASSCSVTMNQAQEADAVFAPKPTCVVPKLEGKALTAAKKAIRRAHCGIGRIRRAASHTVKKNHVISQKPKPKSRLKQGAKITLLVSKGHS